MYNYKLVIEYDGKDFKGWQKQKYTKETIQEHIEIAIEKILKVKVKLIGAGRTDAGVNAYNQVANFKYPEEINLKKFIYSLNSILPGSISIKKNLIVSLDFHSRYSAKRREYIYKITTQKRSIDRNYYHTINYNLDFEKIAEFFLFLKKQKSFKSLCKNKEDKNNFVCEIFVLKYKLIKSKNEIIFTITANRFLHSMIRAVIGCALGIGRNKIKLKDLKDIIKKGKKINIHYLPANALFLNKIYY